MDKPAALADFWNIPRPAAGAGEAATRTIPTYALYGDAGAAPDAEFLHCESVAARAPLHDYEIRPHRHASLFQLLFLSAGAGAMLHAARTEAFAAPCVMLVPARIVHGYSFSNTCRGVVATLFQDRFATVMRAAPEAAAPLAAELIPLVAEPHAARAIGAAMDALAAEFAGRAPGRVAMMQAQLAIALLTALRARPVPPAPADRGRDRIDRFRQLIEQDFARHRPVGAYAARLGVTPVHLGRLCRAHLGSTPLAAINARLVLEARQLLLFSFLSVKEIAAVLGFEDHAYFSRFFARETGVSPSAFRATPQTTPPAAPAPAPSSRAGTPRAPARSRA